MQSRRRSKATVRHGVRWERSVRRCCVLDFCIMPCGWAAWVAGWRVPGGWTWLPCCFLDAHWGFNESRTRHGRLLTGGCGEPLLPVAVAIRRIHSAASHLLCPTESHHPIGPYPHRPEALRTASGRRTNRLGGAGAVAVAVSVACVVSGSRRVSLGAWGNDVPSLAGGTCLVQRPQPGWSFDCL